MPITNDISIRSILGLIKGKTRFYLLILFLLLMSVLFVVSVHETANTPGARDNVLLDVTFDEVSEILIEHNHGVSTRFIDPKRSRIIVEKDYYSDRKQFVIRVKVYER